MMVNINIVDIVLYCYRLKWYDCGNIVFSFKTQYVSKLVPVEKVVKQIGPHRRNGRLASDALALQ